MKSTKENLEDAIAGETHEFKNMYPEMISHAKEEGNKSAEIGFEYANKVEAIHAQLYKKALADPDKFPGAGLLDLQNLRLHGRKRSARCVPGMRRKYKGVFQGLILLGSVDENCKRCQEIAEHDLIVPSPANGRYLLQRLELCELLSGSPRLRL